MIVAVTVAIVLPVGLVMLIVVGDEIAEIEAVVGGDEIDAGPRPAAAPVEKVARSGNALGEISDGAWIALPKGARGISELIVPLGPTGWKLTNLIAARLDVPGFGDQLDAGK